MKKHILILATLLASCQYSAEYKLNEDDLAWMEAYEDGDTVLFESDCGIDTMVVRKTINNGPEKPGIYCFSVLTGNAKFEGTISHNGQKLQQKFLIFKNPDGTTTMSAWFNHRHGKGILQDVKTASLEINGTLHDDLILFTPANLETIQISPLNCESFIWSRSQGLVEYVIEGKKYDFLKKL